MHSWQCQCKYHSLIHFVVLKPPWKHNWDVSRKCFFSYWNGVCAFLMNSTRRKRPDVYRMFLKMIVRLDRRLARWNMFTWIESNPINHCISLDWNTELTSECWTNVPVLGGLASHESRIAVEFKGSSPFFSPSLCICFHVIHLWQWCLMFWRKCKWEQSWMKRLGITEWLTCLFISAHQ